MRIAIVGATGLVGGVMLQVLENSPITVDELILAASEQSVGKELVFRGQSYLVTGLQQALELVLKLQFFRQEVIFQYNGPKNLLQ